MDVIVKGYLQKADSSVEVRRIPVTMEGGRNANGIFKEVYMKLASSFPDLADKHFTIKWQDPDGDFIIMSTDEELQEAISQAQGSPLKVFITVEGVREQCPDEYVAPAGAGDAEEDKVSQSNHDREDPFAGGWPFMGPPGTHMPPPPPGFGFHGPPPPPPPFGPHMGFHGKFGGIRKRGHPGPHCGPARGMPGPVGRHGHGPMMGEHPGPIFHGMGMFGGPHHPMRGHGPWGHRGHHHHGHHPHGERKHGMNNWRANLRDAVPVSHRRWAKVYIRNWRVQNLKNATTTSSDSDQAEVTMESASVPEAYARWLDMILPRWHQRWGQEFMECEEKGTDDAEKEKIKASVPMEFRKWTRWYLARRFGSREAPKFRADSECQQAASSSPCGAGKGAKGCKKEWKKASKMHALATNIPKEHRKWARLFIREWRAEHQIPDRKGALSSESEDTDKETPRASEIKVPADYPKWMHKFLTRWHLWRGEIDAQKVEVQYGGMREFKDTVPMAFRQWVKCYLWRRHSSRGQEDNTNKYQCWLQIFKRKWLKEQDSEGISDVLVMTSSDDDAAVGTSDNDLEADVETCLKKLRLENDSAKKVHFGEAKTNEGRCGKGRRYMMVDSDSSDNEEVGHPRLGKLYPGFRHWAKAALRQWDGSSVNNNEQQGASQAMASPDEEEQIPPHVYNFMCKMMLKMKMKKMKQEMKQNLRQAKMAMKTAKKAEKSKHS